MIKHYSSVFLKILSKNKIHNTINILGLLIGIISAFVIAKYLGYSLSFDQSHLNQERIFQVKLTESEDGKIVSYEGLSYKGVPLAMKESSPEIIDYTIFNQTGERLMTVSGENEKNISFNEYLIFTVDSSFFNLFSFKTHLGNQHFAFQHPHSTVITESIAKKYFGNQNPIGKTIKSRTSWGREKEWTVTCVLKDIPNNSKIKFDLLFYAPQKNNNLWDIPVHNLYVLTKSPPNLAKLTKHVSDHLSSIPILKANHRKINISLIPLQASLNTFEWMLVFVAITILVLSWVNFINLSIAQFLKRFNEIIIRKTLGATKRQLIQQFIFEAIGINLLTLSMAILLLITFYDQLLSLTSYHLLSLSDNSFNINTAFFIVFTIGVLLTSFYPAVFLISGKVSGILKKGKITKEKNQNIRKGLVIAQFAISSVLVIGIFIITAQLDYLKNKELGFNTSNKLVVKPPKDKGFKRIRRMQSLKNNYAKIPWVQYLTSSSTIPAQPYRQEANFTLLGSKKSNLLYINAVDTNFISTYEIQILAGTNFNGTGGTSTNRFKVIINEVSAKAYGLNAKEAIGKKVVDEESKEIYTIVGVVKNYHKTTLKESIRPILLKYNPRKGYITLTLSPSMLTSMKLAKSELKEVWQNIYPDQPFECFLLKERFYQQYKTETTFHQIFSIFTIISVILACIGLLGISLQEISRRKLEIGIRKTFGASSKAILILFIKKYLTFIFFATTIGIPCAHYFIGLWLEEYSYRIVISWKHLLIPPLFLTIIALIAISFHIIQLSFTNPVKILREE